MGLRGKRKYFTRLFGGMLILAICLYGSNGGFRNNGSGLRYVLAEEGADSGSENVPGTGDESGDGGQTETVDETGAEDWNGTGGETGAGDNSGSEAQNDPYEENTDEGEAGNGDESGNAAGNETGGEEQNGTDDDIGNGSETGTGDETGDEEQTGSVDETGDEDGDRTGAETGDEDGTGTGDEQGESTDNAENGDNGSDSEENGNTDESGTDDTATDKDKDENGSETGDEGNTEDDQDTDTEDEEPAVKTKRPKPVLLETSVTLYVGWESYEIFINKLDEEAEVTYKSSKTAVATVDEEGVVTPKKKGTTRITVVVKDSDGRKTKLKLTVKVLKPYTEVTEMTDVLTSEGEFCFKLERYGHLDEVKWTLTGSQFASIEAVSDTDCLIKGAAPGDVVLSAECGDYKESFEIHVYEGSGEAYKITPDKEPYKGFYMSRSEYNKYTKDYYVARSYLERLANAGGGLLVFAAGTYNFTNTLCIPSNTTILIEDGATLVKSEYTGVASLAATQSLFHTVAYNHTTTKFTKYNGEHDIAIIGQGSATIDLHYLKSIAITAAHCQHLTIKGIAFKNLNSAHFIELDASKDVEISGNTFSNYVPSPTQRKEAINLDTPDELTHGFIQGWTSYDKTPNVNVSICDNVFENLETAIGTHKYSEGKYHKNIVIQRNTFVDVTSYVVRMMNWKNSVVSDNYFILRERGDEETVVNAVILNGAVNPTVTGNYFNNFTTAISCAHWKNSGSAKVYAETYNKLSKTNLKAMKQNQVVSCTNNYFEVYTVYGDKTDKYLEKYKFTK